MNTLNFEKNVIRTLTDDEVNDVAGGTIITTVSSIPCGEMIAAGIGIVVTTVLMLG